ncbi:MAG TPA: hypothetical protein DIV44_15130 [Leeuwenhoekiella sp.]|nr:hypothetical protein [Leeuwenhoekiella sp.]HCQ78141.1 hypothetical protein [Leeuwenhoekiella sp.]|tara:strand:+ start:23233 stop:24615 length:1383 start_codon:yes stop_codon:yes gene_type:complete
MINLFEYQNQEPFEADQFDELELFLDDIWNKREKSSYFSVSEDEELVEAQRFLQLLRKEHHLKSNKYVGVIHFNKQTINLLPKVFFQNGKTYTEKDVRSINAHVLWWLSYCRKLRFPNYQTGLTNEKEDFFEILIYLFSKYTKQLLSSSIFQQYVNVERDLNVVKGSVNFNAYVGNHISRGNYHHIPCSYDSFELDNKFNRCIKYVAELLLSVSKDSQSKRNLIDILFILDEVSEESITANQCRSIQFNPMFKEFETVRDYCILFLENSVSFNYKSSLQLFAFLLPMEYVFEDFVFGFIQMEIEELNAKAQISNTFLDTNRHFALKPDLLLNYKDQHIVADTKYKIVNLDEQDSKRGISQSDLYQMVSYAIRFESKKIILFYPNSINAIEPCEIKTLQIQDMLAEGQEIEVKAYQIPFIQNLELVAKQDSNTISKSFDTLRDSLKQNLINILDKQTKSNS